jgi:hypothetical protein
MRNFITIMAYAFAAGAVNFTRPPVSWKLRFIGSSPSGE